jgi:electron transfer flavoprotein alpha subunit
MSVLVYVEQAADCITENSLEALTVARDLSEPVEAAITGPATESAGAALAAAGVSTVHLIEHEILSDFAPEAVGVALAQLLPRSGATAMLGPGTETGNEVMAHVAARLDLPLAANCTEITPGEPWQLTRLRWGGVLLEDATLEGSIKLATIAQHWVESTPAPIAGTPELRAFRPDLGPEMARTRVVERAVATDGIGLATARIVVSGGRGVGSAEAFATLEELAGEIGAAVGCSRVATNNGWRSHADQVGQTGTRISPDLYIACGISGATQHWAGCMGSKRILAINTDAEAPMVQRADYAILGDLHQILPAITDEVRRRKSAR